MGKKANHQPASNRRLGVWVRLEAGTRASFSAGISASHLKQPGTSVRSLAADDARGMQRHAL
ncbi:hypothetical protein BRAS3809_7600001 [Bradyrhizobium sp. STM 3809]|nr:hypothetical protein BRAS3809_7600001 [Bradyrhizobium sp. STM 3809]